MLNEPHEELQPILFSIETTLAKFVKENKRFADKDIEDVFQKLRAFFDDIAKGKEPYEPTSNSSVKQKLIDQLIEIIDLREETGMDDHLVNNENFKPGGHVIAYIESIYGWCFKRLLKSVRFWRKKDGIRGYINFITGQLKFDE